jgi:hypothetical protein
VRDSPCKDISQSSVSIHFRAEPAGLLKDPAQLAEECPGNDQPEAMPGRIDESKSVWLGFQSGLGPWNILAERLSKIFLKFTSSQ